MFQHIKRARNVRISWIVVYLGLFSLLLSAQFCLALDSFQPFKFAVIADPHISVTELDPQGNDTKMYQHSISLLEATVSAINKIEDVDFTLVLGDLTRGAEPWNVNRFLEVMNSLTTPYYVVLGNHDINPGASNYQAHKRNEIRGYMVSKLQGHGFAGPREHWSLDPVPGIHLIGLDSTISGDWGGKLSQAGFEFLINDLKQHRDTLTLVMLHHQLHSYTAPEMSVTAELDKFAAYNSSKIRNVLEDHQQVILTMSGHRHISTRYIREKNVAYFTLPSTVTWPMRYTVFEISPHQIEYHTYDVPYDTSLRQQAKSRILKEFILYRQQVEAGTSSEEFQQFEEFMLAELSRAGKLSLSPALLSAPRR